MSVQHFNQVASVALLNCKMGGPSCIRVLLMLCLSCVCCSCVCSRAHGRSLPTFILLCPQSRPVATWRCLHSLREIFVRSLAMTASPSSPTGTLRLIVITFLITRGLTCRFNCRLAGCNIMTVRMYVCCNGYYVQWSSRRILGPPCHQGLS